MPFSLRYPHLAIRLSLVIVFLWFGMDKFIDPQYWVNMLPVSLERVVAVIHISSQDALFLAGIFEILVAASLLTGFFVRWFAAAALIFVFLAGISHGFGETLIRDVSVLGGLAALILWPERNYF